MPEKQRDPECKHNAAHTHSLLVALPSRVHVDEFVDTVNMTSTTESTQFSDYLHIVANCKVLDCCGLIQDASERMGGFHRAIKLVRLHQIQISLLPSDSSIHAVYLWNTISSI
jgi:hypothetical protein